MGQNSSRTSKRLARSIPVTKSTPKTRPAAVDIPPRPPPPEPQRIIEPRQPFEDDENMLKNADRAVLMQKVFGSIQTQKVIVSGSARDPSPTPVRKMPSDRHTNILSDVKDSTEATRGRLNVAQLKEVLHECSNTEPMPNLSALAKKYAVDERLLELTLRFLKAAKLNQKNQT